MSAVGELNDGECGLTDGSVEDDWRLPDIDELQGLGTDPPTSWGRGAPPVTFKTPFEFFTIITNNVYWSKTETDEEKAFFILMVVFPTAPPEGVTLIAYKSEIDEGIRAWPVRSAN
jgi:hypothetical protein